MNTFIALFRGINVGGKNKIAMKELALLMEECGYENIRTYIQSGNVVFNSKSKPNEKIIDLIHNQHGFKIEVLILSAKDFEKAIRNNPYQNIDGKQCHFYFCKSSPKSANTENLEQLKSSTEEYILKDNVFYLYAPGGIGRSKLASSVEKCLGVATTARNLNTVNKLTDIIKDM